MGPLVALRRIRLAGAILAFAVGGSALLGYDNDNMSRGRRDGPHRVLNRLALEAFWRNAASDPLLSRYDRGSRRTLSGEAVLAGGMLKPSTGEWKGTWEDWVVEGGYTADEPELYASFRHFYDPLALNSELDGPGGDLVATAPGLVGADPAGRGVPYLTDHLNVLTAVWSRHGLGSFNPQINAREWALEGPENNGWSENPFCWRKGLDYLEEAFGATGTNKQVLFSKAWRSLGETMHLLADMTSPPHVRNDSHPGASTYLGEDSDDVGRLRSDPYETLAREGLIRRAAGAGASPVDVSALSAEGLFDEIAGFTNRELFSADTISGRLPSGAELTNANGMRSYPSPRLEQCERRGGYYVRTVAGREVRMADRTWLSEAGWGVSIHRVKLSGPCVEDQAALLIPLAVAGNARLVDLFVPRVKVEIENVSAREGRLTGRVVHEPHGALSRELSFSLGEGDLATLRLDGSLQDWNRYKVSIVGGKIDGDVGGLDLREGQTLRLDVEVGGIVVRSNEATVGDAKPTPTPSPTPTALPTAKPASATGAASGGRWVRDRVDSVEDYPDAKSAETGTGGDGSATCQTTHPYGGRGRARFSWTSPPGTLVPGGEHEIHVTAADAGSTGQYLASGQVSLRCMSFCSLRVGTEVHLSPPGPAESATGTLRVDAGRRPEDRLRIDASTGCGVSGRKVVYWYAWQPK